MTKSNRITSHLEALRQCRRCTAMIAPPVAGLPVASKILLIGQAPGSKENIVGRPFAWTAGKTLFRWFESIGLDEESMRKRIYFAAVCRCFPGKNPKGGDRVPNESEIQNCSYWLEQEFKLLQPELILPVGKLAINLLMPCDGLKDVIGRSFKIKVSGVSADMVPLPHPSGASTWHRVEPGKTLLKKALRLIAKHRAFACAASAR